jgi:hypothetical protein
MANILQLKETIKQQFLPTMVEVLIDDNNTDEPYPDDMECSELKISEVNLWLVDLAKE